MEAIYILYAIPFFFILIGLEYWYAKKKKKNWYRFNDAITNLNIGIGNQAFNLFFKFILFGAYYYIFQNYAFFEINAGIMSFFLALLIFDFFFYWAHRWSHEVNFFWGAHAVHHQSEEYNLSVALRQSWFHNIISFIIFLPIPFLGINPLIFFAAAGFNTLYQFWIHTKAIKKMPDWFEFIFNTPSHHRVHHAINPKYIDKNHGGMFIFWDRIFGTFKEEEEEPVYGITEQLKSWNPAWANVHYYIEMIKIAFKTPKWKDKLKLIFARPGWLPDELGGYQAPKEVDEKQFKKYDTNAPFGLNMYILFQFVLITAGLALFIYHFDAISTFYKVVFFAILILSTTICGAIFESKKWSLAAEYLRLGLIVISLNSFYYYWYIDWFAITLGASLAAFAVFFVWITFSWSKLKEFNTTSPGL
ncbi:MAG: sterol desaturase family protein [Chitinophagaceae bacterium]|nr:MAG: sterol desaturase family protein [Chitinophagaceae bacterium]